MTATLTRAQAMRLLTDEFARIAATRHGRELIEEIQVAADAMDEALEYGSSIEKRAAMDRQDRALSAFEAECRDDLLHLVDLVRGSARLRAVAA